MRLFVRACVRVCERSRVCVCVCVCVCMRVCLCEMSLVMPIVDSVRGKLLTGRCACAAQAQPPTPRAWRPRKQVLALLRPLPVAVRGQVKAEERTEPSTES